LLEFFDHIELEERREYEETGRRLRFLRLSRRTQLGSGCLGQNLE
jgi:hypothetical protein